MKSRPYTEALSIVRAAGLRPTRQRLALFQLLFGGADRHVTAEELHSQAQRKRANVSLATVYNTLRQFTRAGLLREVAIGAGRSYFDTNVSHHHHFYYSDDGELVDIPGNMVALKELPPPPDGSEVERVDIIVRLRGAMEVAN